MTINKIIATIKDCIANGEIDSDKIEKGLLLNISAFVKFLELFLNFIYCESIVQPQTKVNLSFYTRLIISFIMLLVWNN